MTVTPVPSIPPKPIIKDRSILFEGGRTGVLLIHGLGGTPLEMKSLGRRLVDTGATVLCCQLAGHCGTEKQLIETRWQDWQASAEAALSRLAERCDTILVGGLSMGAVLAARLAAEEPRRVQGLIMLAPTLWYDGWSIPWYSFLLRMFISWPFVKRYRFVEREPYGLKDERVRAVVASAMMSGDSAAAGLVATPAPALKEMWRLVDAVKPQLPSVRQPTLLVHAREDDIAGLSNAHFLQRKLGGLVETLILDDSYHLVTVDRQRGVMMESAARFVSRVGGLEAEKPSRRAAGRLHAV